MIRDGERQSYENYAQQRVPRIYETQQQRPDSEHCLIQTN